MRDNTKIKFAELVDIEYLTRFFNDFSRLTKLAIGLLEYPSQKIIIASGWTNLCMNFYRANPDSSKACIESNIYLTSRLKKTTDISIKHCSNGLVDGCAPIVIDGKVIATVFLGQVFFDNPDIEYFKNQARRYNFDEEAFLEALANIPVISEEKFISALNYFSKFAIVLAEVSLLKKNLIEQYNQLEKNKEEYSFLQKSLKKVIPESSIALLIVDENLSPIYIDKQVSKIFGQSDESLKNINFDNLQFNFKLLTPDKKELNIWDSPIVRAVKEKVELRSLEFIIKRKDGSESWILFNGAPVYDRRNDFIQVILSFYDITESKLLEKSLLEERLLLENYVKGRTEDLQKSLETLDKLINTNKGFLES